MTGVVDRLLAPLHRRTAGGRPYVAEVDGLRAVAIAAVVVYHVAGFVAERSPTKSDNWPHSLAYQLARTGHVGVQLFFVISGMVVGMPFAAAALAGGRPVSLRAFYLRRLTRIEPPYVIALLFWTAAFGLSRTVPWATLLRSLPASLAYLHNAVFHRPSDVMPPAWSLEIEVQFYLLAPLLAAVYAVGRGRRWLLASAIIALTVAQRWLRPPGTVNGGWVGQEGQHFLVGLLLADLYVTRWRPAPPRRPWLGDLAATGAAVGLVATVARSEAAAVYAAPALLLLMVAGALRSRWWLAALRNRWAYTVGGMCYTVYLYHGFFKALVGRYTVRLRVGPAFGPNLLVQLAMLVPIILVGSAVLFLLTERPFMRPRLAGPPAGRGVPRSKTAARRRAG